MLPYWSLTALLPETEEPIVMKILLVDDDAFVVEAYSQKLRQAGFEVESAGDGMAAVKMLPALKPDLIVLDLMLPRFSGFELLNYMQTRPDLKDIRVVVLSNFYLGDPERQAAASDADATLMKSNCSPSQLVGTINQLLYAAHAPAPAPPPTPVVEAHRELEP